MAGVGFELRKMLREDTYTGAVKAYAYSAMVACGPWIISILTLVVLNAFLHGHFLGHEKEQLAALIATLQSTTEEGARSVLLADIGVLEAQIGALQKQIQVFAATITHVYAFSLILVGPFGLVLTRYASDRFSDKTPEAIFPSFMAALTVVAAAAALFGVAFFGFGVGGTLLYQLSAAALMVYVCCIFITANYLTALLDYRDVVTNFIIGYLFSGIAAYAFATWLGMPAALFGFAIGQLLLFLLLFRSLKRELGYVIHPSWEVLGYFKKFPALVFVGLLYNLGIWIDKLIYWWFSDKHEQVSGLMWAVPEYDVGIYLSLLSIVPGMAVFFLNVETGFAEKFTAFFKRLDSGGTLQQISTARDDIALALREGFSALIKVQAAVTIFLAVFGEQILGAIGIGSMQLGVFQVTLFGAFLLVIFLSLLTVLFYFDDRQGALLCTAVFVLTNAGLSFLLCGYEKWFGFGFVIASGLAMVIAGRRVNKRLADLEYQVFCGGN